jgi:hypothetical protein
MFPIVIIRSVSRRSNVVSVSVILSACAAVKAVTVSQLAEHANHDAQDHILVVDDQHAIGSACICPHREPDGNVRHFVINERIAGTTTVVRAA